ncbi:MAG: hypothetical protein M3P52_05885 [Actinomycetota bacterium]|nr:hypothetical protein [Actinomycetota bacterium]
MGARAACLLTAVVTALGVTSTSPGVAHAETSTECAAGTDTANLNQFIANELADLVGFDTPRVIALPDGRNVWTVQDAFISATPGARSSSLRPPTGFAHNALVVQEGNCFTTLHGPVTPGSHCNVSDASYVGRDLTAACSHWFWPMSGGLDQVGRLAVFYVEMVNERGSGAAPSAHPVAVWVARLDAATFDLISFAPAPAAAGDVVYGSAIESDSSFSYLFGWSYDQFNIPDPTSPPPSQMFVARVPVGRFDVQPAYWNGTAWVADRAAAVAVSSSPGGEANPMQPRVIDGMWVSVVKAGDWNGTAVRVDVAPAPQGPWTALQSVTVPTRTLNGQTNTYSANLMPWRSTAGNLVVALSNNAWQMDPLALDNPTLYQPRLFELAAPSALPAPQLSASTEPLGFVPTTPPIRAIDTRDSARLAKGQTLRVSLAGTVADDARAAVIDLAAVDPAGAGYLTAWSCDEAMPPTSNLNYLAGVTRAAHAVVTLAADASICVFTMVDTDVIVDVTGSYSTASSALRFHPQAPTRIYDSRISGGRWRSGETRAIPVPPTAAAVAINVTITEPAAPGFVTVFPCQAALPLISNVNYLPGQVIANLVQSGVSDGMVCVHSRARTDVVIDLQGTYDAAGDGLRYQAVAPTRLVDTRSGVGSVFGRVAMDTGALGVWPANAPVATTAVPAEVKALMVSMIAVSPRSAGWAEIGPCVEPAYTTPYHSSTVNFVAADIVANQAITPTRAASGADVCTFATSPAFHVVDLTGWFI